MRIEIDGSGLEGKIERAFERYSQLLEAQFTKEITAKQFTWPTAYKTTRGSYNRKGKGRESVGSPRDIVDSGVFRQSQLRTPVANGYRFAWTVPYSASILYGYKTKRGNQMPARDWITPALKRLPPLNTLQKLLR
jgi:hypothetical protein